MVPSEYIISNMLMVRARTFGVRKVAKRTGGRKGTTTNVCAKLSCRAQFFAFFGRIMQGQARDDFHTSSRHLTLACILRQYPWSTTHQHLQRASHRPSAWHRPRQSLQTGRSTNGWLVRSQKNKQSGEIAGKIHRY